MLSALVLTGLLSTATVTHAFQLCESQHKACVAVRCDAAYYAKGVDGYVACTQTCDTQYENCLERVRSYQ